MVPVQPGLQIQENRLMKSLQTASFLQGFELQSFILISQNFDWLGFDESNPSMQVHSYPPMVGLQLPLLQGDELQKLMRLWQRFPVYSGVQVQKKLSVKPSGFVTSFPDS